MKNLFKVTVIILFAFTLIACGRSGDLIPASKIKIDSEKSTSSTY